MIFDKTLQFSDSQVLTSNGVSTNAVDLGNPLTRGQVGGGHPLSAVIVLPAAPDFTTGDESYQFQLITSANADLSSATVLNQRAPAGAIPAGTRMVMGIPIEGLKRFIGMNYNLGGTTPTLTVTSFLTDEPVSENTDYASAVSQPV
jgi:hypothetical protein